MRTDVQFAKFALGDLVEHKHFGFRGIVFDVDFAFSLDERWYQQANKTLANAGHPPINKAQPFYHILTHASDHESYVSEQNLQAADNAEPIWHSAIDQWFEITHSGIYKSRVPLN